MNHSSSTDIKSLKEWYAFYVKPRHEKKASERLKKRFEIYCPIREERVRWSDRWKIVRKPLLPGYLFACVTENNRMSILDDPSIFCTVCWKGKPAVIKEEEIHVMKRISGHPDVDSISLEPLSPGDRVKVSGGELVDLNGVIVRLKGKKAEVRLESLHSNLSFTVKKQLLERFPLEKAVGS